MDKKSIHEWARIFACDGLVAICDVDRLYAKMLRITPSAFSIQTKFGWCKRGRLVDSLVLNIGGYSSCEHPETTSMK